jgi:hypothetical protein
MKQTGTVLLFVMSLVVILLAACSQQATPLTDDSILDSLATFTESQILVGGRVADDQFGRSVAVDGDRMVVTCECHDRAEVAYIFERGATGLWEYVKTLKARKSPYTYSDHQVTMSGNTIVISSAETGSVYIFDRNRGGANAWGLVKELSAFYYYDGFGVDVSLDEDTLVVGAFMSRIGANDYQGAAYLYERDRGGTNNWGQVRRLTAFDGEDWDNFGRAVSISGDVVVIGAYGDTVGGRESRGSAYVFGRNEGGTNTWGLLKKITSSNGLAYDFFGSSVDVSGDTVVVGAYYTYSKGGKGSAYIFQRNEGGADAWGEVKHLMSNDLARGDYFGFDVAIDADTVLVSAIYDTVGNNPEQGSAYIFRRNRGGINNWGQLKKLTASDGATSSDHFGASVAVSDSTAVVSAPLNDLGNKADRGTGYVFE